MQIHWKKNTAIFLAAQIMSLFGSTLVQFAIVWHITLVTQSGFYMMIAILCGFIPTFLLSPFAGVWADRYNRKRLIIWSDATIAIATLILALSILWGSSDLWLIFVILGIRALGTAVQAPCVGAILPEIVPMEQLTRVNGINGSLQSLITMISPMLSAILLKTTPFFMIFFVDVITAAIAIFMMIFFFKLPQRASESSSRPHRYWAELKQGMGYVRDTKYLKTFFLYLAAFYFMFAPASFLTPLQVTRNFGGDEFYLMLIEVAFSLGMVLGGIVISAWGGFRNRMRSVVVSTVIMGTFTLLLGIPMPLWLYLSIMFLYGVTLPTFATPTTVFLQERVDPDYIGRVFGVLMMISSSVLPAGMLVFGPLADHWPIEWILVATGTLVVFLALRLRFNQNLWAAGSSREKTLAHSGAPESK